MILVSFMLEPNGGIAHRVIVPKNDMWMGVSLSSPYLVAKGQRMDFFVSAQLMPDTAKPRQLQDARPFILKLKSEAEWWRLPHCLVPTNRPLWEVLAEAVKHGVDNPRHGSDCACLDTIIWELRRHIDRALPEVQCTIEDDPFSPEPTIRYNAEECEANMAARMRIAHVLRCLVRDI